MPWYNINKRGGAMGDGTFLIAHATIAYLRFFSIQSSQL